MKQLFVDLVQHANAQLLGSEVLLCNFSGEESDFVRFNHGLVRQPMAVRQASLGLTLIQRKVRSAMTLTISGQKTSDQARIQQAIQSLREDLAVLPEDPYLLYSYEANQSERVSVGILPTPAQTIEDIVQAAKGKDLVGIFASGPIHKGFASSLGALHWHSVEAFLFDWSLYHRADKAAKATWSGSQWDAAELAKRIEGTQRDLSHLTKPAKTMEPGEYRAYLAPAAVEDLVGMFNWEGISAKAQRTQQSCIQKLVEGQGSLSPLINLTEDTARGLAPAFDTMGFTKPGTVRLIENGRQAGSMVSARTAAEYHIAGNGAGEDEGGSSLSLAGGSLDPNDALAALDSGLAIGNLHYLNFSDRPSARITGMTRFASFWVEKGQIVAPVNVMRWDDSLYRMLGDKLEDLTREPQWILSSSTYDERSTQTTRVPGALLSGMAFTL